MKILHLVLALMAFVLPALATTPLYSNCVAIGSLTGGTGLVPGLLGGLGSILGGVVTSLSSGDCMSMCRSQGKKFAIWAQGIDVNLLVTVNSLLGSCWCNDVGVPANQVNTGSDSSGGCVTSVANLIGARVDYIVPNELTLAGCSSSPPAMAAGTSVTTVASIEECAVKCGNTATGSALIGTKPFAVRATATEGCGLLGGLLGTLLTGRTNGQYQCQCAATTPTGPFTTTCNAEVTASACSGILGLGGSRNLEFAWTNYAMATAPSGLARRYPVKVVRTAEENYCPRPLTPCRIRLGDNHASDCVDTNTELESCGGCLLGDLVHNVTAGVDCTTLPGVAMGGVSCVAGKCRISRCRSGYEYSNGACVRKLNLSNTRRVVRNNL